MPRRSKKQRRSSKNTPLTFERFEDRRMLSCTPGGDADDQTCEATTLHPGFFNEGSMFSSTDVDMYEINTGSAPGTSLDFEFLLARTDGNFDPFLRLFDSNGVELDSDDDGGEGLRDSFISITLPSAGTYYLGVSAFSNTNYNAEDGTGDTSSSSSTATGTYALIVSDNDDQISEALPIRIGETRLSAALHTLDVDMFEVEVDLEDSGSLDFTFDLEATGGSALDPYLRLFDASGNELKNADNTILTQRATINHTFTSEGTYYLGVSADENEDYDAATGIGDEEGNSIGAYTLTVSDNNDEIDELSQAYRASGSQQFPLQDIDLPTDVDLIRFLGFEGQTVQFDAIGSNGLDTVLRLFDASGEPLDFDDDGGSGTNSRITFPFEDTGLYYLGVSGFGNSNYDPEDGDSGGGGDTGSYQLRTLDLDPDDTFENATTLGNLFVNGTLERDNVAIDYNSDVDMYRFVVGRDGSFVEIDIDRPTTGVDSFIRLFDSNGIPIDSNDDANAPGESGAVARDSFLGMELDAGVYFVGVSAFRNTAYNPNTGGSDADGDSTGSYSIQIQDRLHVDTADDSFGVLTVDANDNKNTLREAIEFANERSGRQEITFRPNEFFSASTITLAGQPLDSDQLEITDDVTITGPGADLLSVSGDDDNRVFLIDDDDNSSFIDVEISGLEIRDGNTSPGILDIPPGESGAGILNTENLTLRNVVVTSNTTLRSAAVSPEKDGGGIHHSQGTLLIESSVFNDNSAENGGAIFATGGR